MRRGRQLWGIVVSASVLFALLAAAYIAYDYWHDHRFDGLITQVATKHGLSPYLVKAVIWRESDFERDCRGRKGEIGLMQIMPATAREWARIHNRPGFDAEALYEPAVNLDIGCWYLRRALDRWAGSTAQPVAFALAEYNAGRSNALRWATGPKPHDREQFLASITYPTTRRYVQVIEERFLLYARRGGL